MLLYYDSKYFVNLYIQYLSFLLINGSQFCVHTKKFWKLLKKYWIHPGCTPRDSGLTGLGSGLGISFKSVKQPDGAQRWVHSLSFHMCFYTLLHMYEALNITVGQS